MPFYVLKKEVVLMRIFNKREKIYSPINGMTMNIENVNDNVFSEKLIGDGIAIIPSDGMIYAPFDGICTATLQSNHAIGLTSCNNTELIIHIGIDTVKLNGNGFKCFVSQGDKIKCGQKLIEFDKKNVESQGYDTTVMVIVVNKQIRNRAECDLKIFAKESAIITV